VPQLARTRSLEVTNELSWLPGEGRHRIKLGALLVRGESDQEQSQNRFGTFTYLSLADFEANRPSSFTRTLAPGRNESSTRNDALYLADTWCAAKNPNIGAICVKDVKPRDVTSEEIGILQDLARLVVDELELRKIATVDALTGALTKRAFLAEGDREIWR
jgi:hypothetical protein